MESSVHVENVSTKKKWYRNELNIKLRNGSGNNWNETWCMPHVDSIVQYHPKKGTKKNGSAKFLQQSEIRLNALP